MVNDPGKQFFSGLARMAGNVLGGLLGDEKAYRNMGWSRKQAKLVRDAVIVAAENDPGFGKKFGKALAKESTGSFSDSKYRGGDPFSLTVQDLVEMYGRDPAKGKRDNWPKQTGGNLWAIGSDDEEIFMDDMMDF